MALAPIASAGSRSSCGWCSPRWATAEATGSRRAKRVLSEVPPDVVREPDSLEGMRNPPSRW